VNGVTAPAFIAAIAGSDLAHSPVAPAAWLIRRIAGRGWVERQSERIDGLSVIALFGFAVALMGIVLPSAIERPWLVIGLIALVMAISIGLSVLTALLLTPAGRGNAFALAHAAGSRNMGLMLAASAGQVPELVWLYVALAQFPIYLLPLVYKPLARRLGLGQDGATN
jgi:hypothetical protein